jgi:hypothetical protein
VEETQCAVTRDLNNISKTASPEGMKKLKERANRCIDQGGMYSERIKINYVHIRSYLSFITFVLIRLDLTLYYQNTDTLQNQHKHTELSAKLWQYKKENDLRKKSCLSTRKEVI